MRYKEIERVCMDCGTTFTARSQGALRCAKCKDELKKQRSRENSAQYRKLKLYRSQPSKTINEVMRELAAYNEEHNTHLSYGQYVLKIEGRQGDGRKKR